MASYIPNGRQQFCDANGSPLALGSVGMYVVGTTTHANTWQDAAQAALNANPIPLDAGGYASIYGSGLYRQIVKDVNGNVIWDRIAGSLDIGSTGPITASFAAPAFTNTAFASSFQVNTNGATPGTFYSALQAGNNATEALTSAIIVPASATNHQTNALSSYIRSDRSASGNGGEVAAYHQALSNADSATVFPINTVAQDTVGKTGQTLGIELDYNVNAADTTVNGVNATIVGNTALSGTRIAYSARGVFSANSQWSHGFYTSDGGISQYAVFIGATSATTLTDRDSQPIALVSYKSDNTRYIATILGDHTGGLAIRPGLTTAAIAFQSPTGGANWFSVNAVGAGYPTGTGGTVTQATSKSTGATLNKVCGAITLNNAALAANTVVFFTFTNSSIAADDFVDVWVKSGNATAGTYRCWSEGNGAGTRIICLQNISGGSLSEAVVLGFGVNKRAVA